MRTVTSTDLLRHCLQSSSTGLRWPFVDLLTNSCVLDPDIVYPMMINHVRYLLEKSTHNSNCTPLGWPPGRSHNAPVTLRLTRRIAQHACLPQERGRKREGDGARDQFREELLESYCKKMALLGLPIAMST